MAVVPACCLITLTSLIRYYDFMAQVTFTYNPEPAPACYPADVNGLAQLLTQGGMLAGQVPDTAGGGIFVGAAPPSSSLTYKVWFKIDGAGRPLGAYQFYNGNWRKVYTNVGIGDVKMYYGSGNNFDSTGLGVVGGDTDGWAICNGQNSTPNMTDMRFPAGGNWNGSKWDAPSVGGGRSSQGGENGHKIDTADLFELQVLLGSAAGRWAAGSAGSWLTVPPYTAGGIESTYAVTVQDANGTLTSGLPGAGEPLPLPQYQVFAFIMFVGYT